MVSELQEWLLRQADVPADTAPRQGAITCEERETEAGQDLARGAGWQQRRGCAFWSGDQRSKADGEKLGTQRN